MVGRVRRTASTLVTLLTLGAPLGAVAAPLGAQDLTCGPGDTEVRRLEITGNHAFDAAALAQMIVTTPSSWIQRVLGIFGTRRCLDRSEFPRDRLRLILFYRNSGYPDVQVDTALRPVRPHVVDAIFRIREGRPIRIQSLTISGLDSLPPAVQRRITRTLPVRQGGAFDKYAIGAAIDTLTQRLRNNGYPYGDVLPHDSSDVPTHSGTVAFTVVPGPAARVGRVIASVKPRQPAGRSSVAPSAVTSVMGLKSGRPYRLSDLVAAQRALIQTDAFQHIRVAIDSARASGHDSTVDIHADVVEGYLHSARVAAGWATLDCFRTRGEYADRDFLGGLDLLRLSASVTKVGIGYPFGFAPGICPQARNDIYSDTLNYGLSASLRTPVLFGSRLDPTATIFSQRQSEYNAYVRSVPIGGSVTLTRHLTASTTLQPEYQFEYGRTTAQPALYCAVFNLCQPQDIAPLQALLPFAYGGLIIDRDRRDNVDDPHFGSLIQTEGRIGSRFLGSSPRLQFDRGTLDAAGYLGLSTGAVLAAHLRLGAVAAPGQAAGGFIPPQERLYAGGPTTVRGFVQNELGPVVYIPNTPLQTPPATVLANGDTVYRLTPSSRGQRVVPEGGNWSVVANLEYRSPRFLRNLLQWAAFADAGQVWNGNISGIHGLLWTPGVGIRAFTPVGPLRVDIGYNPYLLPVGAAYFNAAAIAANAVPLYCVSPGNTIPVTTHAVTLGGKVYQIPEQAPGAICPATYRPVQSQGFFHQLTFNISIGQAF